MSKPFRLVVAGGRQFSDRVYLADAIERSLEAYAPAEVLRSFTPESYGRLQIVSGGAAGADQLGERWAAFYGVPVQRYPAQWDALDAPGAVVKTRSDGVRYNARAGFDRNVLMAQNADAVLVMPGGKGTDHMVQTALAHGLPVWDARAGDARAVVLLEPPRRVDAVAPRPATAAASSGAAQPAAASAPPPFEIVASRGPGASFDVLGMRQDGRVMATIPVEKGGSPRLVGVSAPFEPGWLGNPWVANDAGGPEWMTREKATELFGELVREKAKDPVWRDAFLALEGKRVGYYKPDEPAIHLHEVQRVIPELKQQLEQERMAAAAAAAAVEQERVQLELELGGGGGNPPPPRPPLVVLAEPPEPQRGPGPGPQAPASRAPAPEPPPPDDPVVIAVQEDPKRKAGDLLPWLLAAGGGAAAGGGLAYLMQQGQAPQDGSG